MMHASDKVKLFLQWSKFLDRKAVMPHGQTQQQLFFETNKINIPPFPSASCLFCFLSEWVSWVRNFFFLNQLSAKHHGSTQPTDYFPVPHLQTHLHGDLLSKMCHQGSKKKKISCQARITGLLRQQIITQFLISKLIFMGIFAACCSLRALHLGTQRVTVGRIWNDTKTGS